MIIEMRFVDFPEVIYILFKSFLSNDDFIQLVSSCQRYFKEIRKRNLYLKLNHLKSERFCVDKSYRDYILSRVSRPDRQISMSLPIDMVQKYKDLLAIHLLRVSGKPDHGDHSIPFLPAKGISLSMLSQIQDITTLGQLEKVSISSCKRIIDISALKDVKDVSIMYCDNITEFSSLGKQETLYLYHCPSLMDVGSLGNIQTLKIDCCENLIDVSPLHGIPFLSIINCAKVKDISGLGNHQSLKISRCSYDLKGYEILETVKDISLDSCNITDVGMMTKARSVELRNLSHLKDVSSLVHVKELTLVNCQEIEDISMLEKVRTLHFGSLPAIRRYDGIEHHQNLTISFDQSKEKMDKLANFTSAVKNLHLYRCDFSVFVLLLPSFSRLMFLSLSWSGGEEFELQGCEDIHTVELKFCSKITTTKGLGRNQEVLILGCDKMNDVSHLANVPIVTIKNCRKLVDVSCLANVPILKVSSCGVKETV